MLCSLWGNVNSGQATVMEQLVLYNAHIRCKLPCDSSTICRSSEKAIRMATLHVKYSVAERNLGNFKDTALLITFPGHWRSYYSLLFVTVNKNVRLWDSHNMYVQLWIIFLVFIKHGTNILTFDNRSTTLKYGLLLSVVTTWRAMRTWPIRKFVMPKWSWCQLIPIAKTRKVKGLVKIREFGYSDIFGN
jgi:hypothetical protein